MLFTRPRKDPAGSQGIPISILQKAPLCPYRLMNILFSDRFAEEFAHLRNVADQVNLANNQLFWEGVQEAFEGQYEAYNNMHFVDDEVFSEIHHLYFRRVFPHNKLKNLNAEYKAALSCFRLLGNPLVQFL